MKNSEISFKNTLSILNDERNKALCLSGANMLKMMHMLDGLIEIVVNNMEQNIDNVVLIGSELEVEIKSEDFDDFETFIISDELSLDETLIPYYGPLGRCVLGHKVGETVYFDVQDSRNYVTINAVNNVKEQQKLLKK